MDSQVTAIADMHNHSCNMVHKLGDAYTVMQAYRVSVDRLS